MSDPVSALSGASFDGFAQVREAGPVGMVTLRAKPDVAGLAEAVKSATGCDLPGQRKIARNGERAAGWMGPDELLLVMPHGEAEAAVAAISAALKGQHHLPLRPIRSSPLRRRRASGRTRQCGRGDWTG